MKRFSPGRPRLFVIGVVAAWLAMLAVPPWLLGQWRAGRLAELSDPAVQAEWDTFREAMRRESDRSGPVQRKVPKSPEPPERVWLRDYFALAVATWVILVGVLGGFLALLVLGITKPA
ncbi:MAG: hypothetical protein NZ658_00470, partial [Pirellulales bacterium]|nr:hypothetical protein [Pirellulales bacterium]